MNGFSICNKPHGNVTLTVQLWEEGTFTRRLVAQSTVRNPGTLPPKSKLRNLSTFELCKNRESHIYFGRAFGKALVNGVWHYARDDFEGKLFPIPCGT